MNRNLRNLTLAAALSLAAAVPAYADDGGDNSMSRFTGDSWSALQDPHVLAGPPRREDTDYARDVRQPEADALEYPVFASASARRMAVSPFRDDTGA